MNPIIIPGAIGAFGLIALTAVKAKKTIDAEREKRAMIELKKQDDLTAIRYARAVLIAKLASGQHDYKSPQDILTDYEFQIITYKM